MMLPYKSNNFIAGGIPILLYFWIKKKTSWLEAKERLFRGKRIRKPYKETKIFFFKFVID